MIRKGYGPREPESSTEIILKSLHLAALAIRPHPFGVVGFPQGPGQPSRGLFPNVPLTRLLHSGLPAKWDMLRLPLLYFGALQVIQPEQFFLNYGEKEKGLG